MISTKRRNYASDSRRIGSVTRMPGMLLRIKGKVDSSRGQGVCDAYIAKLRSRLAIVQSREVTNAENELFPSRREAAVILADFSEKRRKLREIPKETNGRSVEDIRADRKIVKDKENMEKDIHLAMESLISINETIINVDTVLEERISRARNHAAAKIETYVSGIRSGKEKDYQMTGRMDDQAMETYRRKHQALYDKINETTRSIYEEGEYESIQK